MNNLITYIGMHVSGYATCLRDKRITLGKGNIVEECTYVTDHPVDLYDAYIQIKEAP